MSFKNVENEVKRWGFSIEYIDDGVIISSIDDSEEVYEFKCTDDEYLDEWSCYIKGPEDNRFKMIYPSEAPYNLKESQQACVIWFFNEY